MEDHAQKNSHHSLPSATSQVLPENPLISNARLTEIYSAMLRCRMLEEVSRRFAPHTAAPGQYDVAIGHEAALVSTAMQLRAGDTVGTSPLEFVRQLVSGGPVSAVLRSLQQQSPAGAALLEQQLGRAVKAARRQRGRHPAKIALCYSDDRIAAEECWHDAMREACSLELPMVFVWQSDRFHENSSWYDTPSASPQYGFPIITVDGNDAIAVYRVAQEASHRARAGFGPTLIECRTYRWHHKSQPQETAFLDARDPILKIQRQLEVKHIFDPQWACELERDFRRELESALADRATHIPPSADRMPGFSSLAGQK